MIRQHSDHVRAAVFTRRTKSARQGVVALHLDGIRYQLTPNEARALADQLHDHAEEIQ